MSGISIDRLKNLAGTNTELRLKDGKVTESEGSLGGRLARNLNIKFSGDDRSTKQKEYIGAKDQVLMAMIEHYGEEIGTKAFRAGVGHLTGDGAYETSRDHPISGRHIEKMLEVAEKEFGPSTMGKWMDRHLGRDGEGTRQVEMGEKVTSVYGGINKNERPPGRFSELADMFTRHARWKLNLYAKEEQHYFAVVKVGESGTGASIGLHLSSGDMDHVDVLLWDGHSEKVPVDRLHEALQNGFNLYDPSKLGTIGLYEVKDKGIVHDEVSLKDISLDRTTEADGDERGVRNDFEDLAFNRSGGTQRATLRQVFTDDKLAGFSDAYKNQFNAQELHETNDSRKWLSPNLSQRLRDGARIELVTKNGSGPGKVTPPITQEQRGLLNTQRPDLGDKDFSAKSEARVQGQVVEKGIRDAMHVVIPRFGKESGVSLTPHHATLLSRFANDGAFVDLYRQTSEALGLAPEDNPKVTIETSGQRGPNGEPLINLSFHVDLPEKDGVPGDRLHMQVQVPVDQLNEATPKITLSTPYLTRSENVQKHKEPVNLNVETFDDDVVNDLTDGPTEEVDTNVDVPELSIYDLMDAVAGDLDGIRASRCGRTSHVGPGNFMFDNTQLPQDLQTRLYSTDRSIEIEVGGKPLVNVKEDTSLQQLAVLKSSDGTSWNLDATQRGNLASLIGGDAFDRVFSKVAGREELAKDLAVQVSVGNDGNIDLTFRGALPLGGTLVMTMRVGYDALRQVDPPPEVEFRALRSETKLD